MKTYPFLSDLPVQNRTDRAYNINIIASSPSGDEVKVTEVVSYHGEFLGPVPESVREAKGIAQFRQKNPNFTNVRARGSIHV